MRPLFWLTTAVAVTAFTGQQQPPSFRSRVDVVTIDVHVVDRDGQPVRDLRPEDFALTVDGKARRAVAANLVSYGGNPRFAEGTPAAGHREGADPIASPSAAPGRLVLLVVDEANIRAGYARFAADAALAFVDRAQPSDRIGLVSIPYTTVCVEPTRDRAVLKQGLQRIAGHLTSVETQVGAQYAVGLSEAFMFVHDRRAFAQVLTRECVEKVPGATSPSGPCQAEVENLARTVMTDARQRMLNSARSLISVIEALGQVEGPKTLVLLSEELPVASFVSERKDFEAETSRISAAAARAQANVYVLHLNSPLFDVENRVHPGSATADADVRASGLETVATLTGGRRLMVSGRPEAAFERIVRETSAFYVVGFEAEPADRDGKPHLVRVTANRKGIEVRARREFVFSGPSQMALADALNETPGTPRAAAAPATTGAAPNSAPPPPPSNAPAAPLSAPEPGQPGIAAAPATTPGSAARTVEDPVARAGRYILAYAEQMAMVIGTEHYAQWMTSPDFGRAISCQLVSEFALLRVQDDWLGFRYVYQVDGRAVGDRQDRLLKLLLDRTPGGIDQGRRIADESARYNLGAIQRNFNVPTTALLFLEPRNQARFTYRKDGEDLIDGVRAWKVRYQETRRPTIIRTSAGKDMPLKGTFWLDPVDGRVLKTHMEMTSEVRVSGKRQEWGQERGEPVERAAPKSGIREWSDRRVDSNASITVTYKADPRLGILLPAEMLETYEGAWARRTTNEEALTKISCRATYSDFKRFETSGKVIER